MPGPLTGITVLDLSRVMAGPWAGQILADLGADVIKIERPGQGDETRAWGPPFLDGDEGRPDPNSGYYLSVNRGKRSVVADLNTPEGQRTVLAIARQSDILLENYKVDTLKRFRLDYETLRASCPRLIYCSITGFGQTGPRRAQPAYDFIIQAMGGLMSITGGSDEQPGGGPQKVGIPIVDIMTGMYTAVAVLAALEQRRRTGAGDHIDIAMFDVQAAFLANQAMNYLLTGKTPIRRGNRHPNIQPQNVFPCRDGHIALAVGNDSQFRKLCEVLGRPELADDSRFQTNAGRVRHLAQLEPILIGHFAAGEALSWVTRLEAAGVPAGRINSIRQVFEEEQLVHRGMLRMLPHPRAGTVPSVVSPMRFANGTLHFERAAPLLGEHTEEVLRELNLASPGNEANQP
jgi:crotonobetainyl-CoA:carnitine CoA-transferase CaiB-like acyl-CoA transferase